MEANRVKSSSKLTAGGNAFSQGGVAHGSQRMRTGARPSALLPVDLRELGALAEVLSGGLQTVFARMSSRATTDYFGSHTRQSLFFLNLEK